MAIDMYCGLGGWSEGLMAEGYSVVGFDMERHVYGDQKYPAQLVLQDVKTIHGSQFKNARLIVASPPCQEFSYMAMPFSRGKRIAAALRGQGEFPEGYIGSRTIEELNALFNACFRIQREACEAAGRHVPMVVENVKGAQPWVGSAKAKWGSNYLWGDVPALLPFGGHVKQPECPSWFHGNLAGSARRHSSKSKARKAWTANISKIPIDLSSWIARCYYLDFYGNGQKAMEAAEKMSGK